MAMEIERKFVVVNERWRRDDAEGHLQQQGYLSITELSTARVRIENGKATLALKSNESGARRSEYEYAIPLADGQQILATLCTAIVEKTRYILTVDDTRWEIDVFHGANDGLVTAEIELAHESEAFALPDWVGREVTDDSRYRVAALAQTPYATWAQ